MGLIGGDIVCRCGFVEEFVDSVYSPEAIWWFVSRTNRDNLWVLMLQSLWKRERNHLVLWELSFFYFFVCDHEHWSSRFEIVVRMPCECFIWKCIRDWMRLYYLFGVCMYCVCRYLNFWNWCFVGNLKGGQSICCRLLLFGIFVIENGEYLICLSVVVVMWCDVMW